MVGLEALQVCHIIFYNINLGDFYLMRLPIVVKVRVAYQINLHYRNLQGIEQTRSTSLNFFAEDTVVAEWNDTK